MTYEIVDCYDVWGNDEDGYEVNDVMLVGTIELPENVSDTDIIKILKEYGALGKFASKDNISIERDDMFIEVFNKDNGYPLHQLRRL